MFDVKPLAPTRTARSAAAMLWDVVVVGGGPAGAILAAEVAKRRRSVLVVDQATFPRSKVCGCCLNAAGLRLLQHAGLSQLPALRGAASVNCIELRSGTASCRLPVTPGAVISREVLDTELLRNAVSQGAELLTGASAQLEGYGHSPHRLRITRNGERFTMKARVVVAADGIRCSLLRGQSPFRDRVAGTSRIGGGTVIRPAAPLLEPGKICMSVGQGGYVGIVRMPDGSLDVAAAFDPEHVQRSGSLAAAATTVLEDCGLDIPELRQATWQGTPRLTRQLDPVAHGKAFAVGDAAAYVEPFTGEGMAWAMLSGFHAAPLVAAAVEDESAQQEQEWIKLHARLVGTRMKVCRAVSRILRRPTLSRHLVTTAAWMPRVAGMISRGVGGPLAA